MMMSEDKALVAARTKLTEFLDSRKLRKTPERFAILDLVFSHNDHFRIETLYQEMEARSYHVSRSTVYNTMELFCECGVARKLQFGSQLSLYEKVVGYLGNHHHLICTECGKIREVKDTELMSNIERHKYGKFNSSYFTLYVYGICSACVRKKKSKIKSNQIKNIKNRKL